MIAKTEMDKKIFELALNTDHKTLGIWAAECAERVLPYFEKKRPENMRPREAIVALREWVRTGIFKMASVRKYSLDAHAAARDVSEDNVARSAARAAGQAMATAHVKTHSIAAALYATTVIRDATNNHEAVIKERQWQYERLVELKKNSEIRD